MEREIIQDGTSSLFKKDDFNFTYGRNYSKVFLGDLQGRTIGRSTHWAQGPGKSPPAPRAPHFCYTFHIRGGPEKKGKKFNACNLNTIFQSNSFLPFQIMTMFLLCPTFPQ